MMGKKICPDCGKMFLAKNLDRHVKMVHQKIKPFNCDKCNAEFSQKHQLKRHKTTRHVPGASSTSSPPPPPRPGIPPLQSSSSSSSFSSSSSSSSLSSSSSSSSKQSKKRKSTQTSTDRCKKRKTCAKERDDEQSLLSQLPIEVQNICLEHWESVKTHERPGKIQSVFTFFRLPNTTPDWEERLAEMFDVQQKRFKINYSHSFLLKHKESNELLFIDAGDNNHRALEIPYLVSKKQDFLRFVQEFQNHDALEHAKNERSNSKYRVEFILATSFYINPIGDFPIGCCTNQPLPSYITENRHLHTLQKNQHNGKVYNDNLCFFRALALHDGADTHALERPTKKLFKQWQKKSASSLSNFSGITLSDLSSLEESFKINIEVFEFDEKQFHPCLVPLQRSTSKYSKTLQLLHYKGHFMFIIDINKLAHAFQCSECGKHWKKQYLMKRHEKTCQGFKSTEKYVGGVYQATPSVMETLKAWGLQVDTSFIFPYRATFDVEVYYQQLNLPQHNTQYTAQHIPLSASVASNVPKFKKPVCFVSEGDSQSLIDRMIDHLEQISDHSYRLLRKRFSPVFKELDAIEQNQKNTADSKIVPTSYLKTLLDDYLRELPVIGFNSGKYDINVIKPYFFKRFVIRPSENKQNTKREEESEESDYECYGSDVLDSDASDKVSQLEEEEEMTKSESNAFKFVVKRNNTFLCICTQKLKFVDIVNFLAPGFSYAKYLAAYNVKEEKGFFPHEYITSLDKLQDSQLPQHSAFYSNLKKSNITDEQYAFCQSVWNKNKMTSLREFLIWYNNRDVVPFLSALDIQIASYASLGIDMLKEAISAPGISLLYLFKTLPSQSYFSLFSEKTKDIHKLIRENITGGPSIIFHRYHETNKTYIRNNREKPVQSIEGFDANALYLWALGQDMPTEHPIIRKKENNFKAERTDRFGRKSREWLEWIMHSEKINLQHKFNGREKQLGQKRIRVDGWHPDTETAYQFHGCYFHGHENCRITGSSERNQVNKKTMRQLREKTREITTYLRQEVRVKVEEMWECEWDDIKESNPQIDTFLSSHFPIKTPSYQGKETLVKQDIIEAIRNGTLFGLVECDIHVPEALRERFSEMTPIFKNTFVQRKDIGPFMKAYAEEHKMLSKPVKTLIGSYVGNKVLLATPLLKWYLENDLEVTAIYLVVEFQPKPCFRTFTDEVTKRRLEGDIDPSKAILSETFKLLGNSAYGKTLTNVSKHRDIAYVQDFACQKLINDKRFRKLTELTEGLYEVEMAKNKIFWQLPLQIGYFVYQYAKLRMLQFYYDCIDKYVDRSDFQLCEMDTDSLYMALSAPRFDETVRPELKESFFRNYFLWFPGQACDEHHQNFVDSKTKNQPWDPSSCAACCKRKSDDKRTPGLFKTEYTGDCFVGLCSKTYACSGETNKLSTKGLNKNQNQLNKDHLKAVLDTKQSSGGYNTGFKTDGKFVRTYTQHRNCLSYLYIKRKVDEDDVTTSPLDI